MSTRGLVLALALVGASGCATLVSGTTERIRFESIPPGAEVRGDGQTYTTPVVVELPRVRDHDAEFVLGEHAPVTRQVTRATNGWLYGNIPFGGLIGVLLDGSMGGAYDLEPGVVTVQLVRHPVPTPLAAPMPETGGCVPSAPPPLATSPLPTDDSDR